MNCTEAQKHLDAYVDGEADPKDRAALEAHLESCTRCAKALEETSALRRAVRARAARFPHSADLESRIMAQIGPSPSELGRRSRSPWPSFVLAAAVGAAACAAGFVLARAPATRSDEAGLGGEIVSAHIRSLLAEHLTDVASSDQHTVAPWFEGKLDYSLPVKSYAAAGFVLRGGRLDYVGERPVASLVYQVRKHVINVFVWPDQENTADEAPAIARSRGYASFHFRTRGLEYWAVSDVDERDLANLVQLIQGTAANVH